MSVGVNLRLLHGQKLQIRNAADTAYLDVVELDSNNDIKIGQELSQLKLKNNTYLQARNAADGANIDVIKVNANDDILLGAEVAQLKMKNNVALTGRNNADSADISMLKVDTSDDLVFGADLMPSADSTHNLGSATVRPATVFADTVRAAALTIDGTNLLESFTDAASMTPVPTGASGTITTETSTGRWARVGPLVFLVLKVAITDVGTATGDLTITLPAAVPAAADISMDQPLSVTHSGINYGTGELEIGAKVITNTKTIQLVAQKDDAAPAVVDAENATIELCGCYFAE